MRGRLWIARSRGRPRSRDRSKGLAPSCCPRARRRRRRHGHGMMETNPNIQMACAVLPSFPVEVEAYKHNGAALTLRICGAGADLLEAFVTWAEVREEMDLLIPVRHPERGGYDIACQ